MLFLLPFSLASALLTTNLRSQRHNCSTVTTKRSCTCSLYRRIFQPMSLGFLRLCLYLAVPQTKDTSVAFAVLVHQPPYSVEGQDIITIYGGHLRSSALAPSLLFFAFYFVLVSFLFSVISAHISSHPPHRTPMLVTASLRAMPRPFSPGLLS